MLLANALHRLRALIRRQKTENRRAPSQPRSIAAVRNVLVFRIAVFVSLLAPISAAPAVAADSRPLFARGYSTIPEPQQIELKGADFPFGQGWQLSVGGGVQPQDVAIQVLGEDLQARYNIKLAAPSKPTPGTKLVRLMIHSGAVQVGAATDRDKDKLAEEAYELRLAPDSISITANAAPGLLYGAETLVQLVKQRDGVYWLPEGRILDWPDVQNRFIQWDDKAHLDRFDVLKDVLRQAAFYKVNGVLLKLNAHFQYASAPAAVEPYALTPAQLQELTDYGLRFHVQLIPYLDAPAHIAWILKHPEYAQLRAFPDSNYEICTTNPDSYKLLEGMYQDVLNANKGVKYFLLSTDEPYYVGLGTNAQCNEVDKARQLGSVGKLLADFITQVAGFLHDHGRTVMFWGEYPLKPEDIPSLPSYLINGEVYGPEFDQAFRKQGIREMIFTYTQADEQLFPNYYLLPEADQVNYSGTSQADEAHFRPPRDRIDQMYHEISFWGARQTADLMGTDICAWADVGLHPETFWLGFAAGAGWIWRPGSPGPEQAKNSFYRLYYGDGALNMDRVYQLMSLQAQFWDTSWERGPSSARSILFGNSDAIFPRPPHDQVISLPPVPQGEYLRLDYDWRRYYERRRQLVEKALAENDELLGLLHANLQHVQFHAYNMEVYLSMARLYRHNLELFESLDHVAELMQSAQMAAAKLHYSDAIANLDDALSLVYDLRGRRNQVLQDTTDVWYKSWYPRVSEANGRKYLLVLNSVQDYPVDRTLGLKYLIRREFYLPIDAWFSQVQEARNRYAVAHNLAHKNIDFDWQNESSTSRSSEY
jgi:hexosaminidase